VLQIRPGAYHRCGFPETPIRVAFSLRRASEIASGHIFRRTPSFFVISVKTLPPMARVFLFIVNKMDLQVT
jgi:hypothetical protein